MGKGRTKTVFLRERFSHAFLHPPSSFLATTMVRVKLEKNFCFAFGAKREESRAENQGS